jgi:Fe2+ or Zn2+ uptake regulation protein
VQQTDIAIEQRLAAHGIRFTKGRRALVAALTDTEGPRTAAELHAQLEQSVPLSSLYRSLTVLSEAGVIATHHGQAGILRFELAEWLTGHHHHLICTSCGAVIDAVPSRAQEAEMRHIVETMATPHGFEPGAHRFEIEGRCATCR